VHAVRRLSGGFEGSTRSYTFLSVDFHIATARDVGHTLRELGHAFLDKSLSGACARRHTCADAKELPVLTQQTGFTLCPRPHALRRAAFEALRASPLLAQTDAVVCSHPAALCEVWLPFNKSILLIVTANLELARENSQRWAAWLRTIVAMSKAPRVVVAANNRYDQAYVRHFTGVRPLYLPTLANYVSARYSARPHKPFLFARSHHRIARTLLREVRALAPGLRVASVEEAYRGNAASGGYELAQLASHPGVVFVPYTKSTMTFFELYRMAVPLFVPSVSLLTQWELSARVLTERVYWKHAPSPLRRPRSANPNAVGDKAALEHWIPKSDPYVFPHVQYFDSAADLAHKLRSTDLRAVSTLMARYSAEQASTVQAKWSSVVHRLFRGLPHGSFSTDQSAGGFDRALHDRFGLALPQQEPDCSRQSAPDLGLWN